MKKGMTLIEILVAIAVILVLVSILIPVFLNTRKQGRATQCASNMHQVSLALELYREDNDGGFPWILYADVSPILRYSGAKDVWRCPLDFLSPGANAQASARLGSKVSYYPLITILPDFVTLLKDADSNHGLFACLVHGQKLDRGAMPLEAVDGFDGLVLRVRVDGSIGRDHVGKRCYLDPSGNASTGRLQWDFFTEAEPPPTVVDMLTDGARIVPCP